MAAKRPSKAPQRKSPPPPPGVMETKVFKTGNSYAVRLPKPLYNGGEAPVYVRKLDNGKLLIVPKGKKRWPSGFLESFGNMPADFEAPTRPAASTLDDEPDSKLFTGDE